MIFFLKSFLKKTAPAQILELSDATDKCRLVRPFVANNDKSRDEVETIKIEIDVRLSSAPGGQ